MKQTKNYFANRKTTICMLMLLQQQDFKKLSITYMQLQQQRNDEDESKHNAFYEG